MLNVRNTKYNIHILKCIEKKYINVFNRFTALIKNGSGVLCDTFIKISYFDGLLGRHLEYWSYARFAKVANAGFLN